MLMTSCLAASKCVGPVVHEVYHIVEDPRGIRVSMDCEVPSERYYEKLAEDMVKRHPKASMSLLEHLGELVTCLDVPILSSFSYGSNKAFVAMTSGSLWGHRVNRSGATVEPERTAAIVDLAPLKDVTQLRQFLGCTNWVRHYLEVTYSAAVRVLG